LAAALRGLGPLVGGVFADADVGGGATCTSGLLLSWPTDRATPTTPALAIAATTTAVAPRVIRRRRVRRRSA
jgi:hypothetical protein